MPRYFIEVAYKGTNFKGFQIQERLNTIQGEINQALSILLKINIESTTSSRTDAGVHAYQNYLHVDCSHENLAGLTYNLNAILPYDIVIKNIIQVETDSHARFDATSRSYVYFITQKKNPFIQESAYYYPFSLDIDLMNQGAAIFLKHQDFTSFSKKNTDVKTFICSLKNAYWQQNEDTLSFHVESNRFLRGMVRAMVATLLKLGRHKLTIAEFEQIIIQRDCVMADFSAVAKGLFLEKVNYPDHILNFTKKDEMSN